MNAPIGMRQWPAFLALFVALAALALAWLAYDQARRHPQLPSAVVSAQVQPDLGTVGLFVENPGHMAGKVVGFELALDGEAQEGWSALTAKLAENRIQLFPNFSPEALVPVNVVLRPGDRVALYTVPPDRLNVFDLSAVKRLFMDRIGIALTICSDAGECRRSCRNMPACEAGSTTDY